MKSCPACNRTYPDDTLAFCLMDGAVLSAPYDPQATRRPPDARRTTPTPTEVMPRGVISEDNAILTNVPSPPITTIQAPLPSVPSVDWSNETASKVSADELDRLVKVWEDKVGRRSRAGDKVRFVVLRLLAFGLAVLSAFFGLRALGDFFRENGFSHGYWQFGLVQASLAIILGWGALRCWRLAGTS